jgi:hypothetical protein
VRDLASPCAALKYAAAMKTILQSALPSTGRLVCCRCGLVADPGGADWHALTAVSHSGSNVAAERAGHAVALDLCRRCTRETLRAVLGIRPRSAALIATAAASASVVAVPTFDTVCSFADAQAFISACSARMEAIYRGEPTDAAGCADSAPVVAAPPAPVRSLRQARAGQPVNS